TQHAVSGERRERVMRTGGRRRTTKRTVVPLVTAAVFGFCSPVQSTASPPAPAALVKARRLLDPRTGNVLSPAAVLIENGKIKEVGPPPRVEAAAPTDVAMIDLGGATVLPGLIDSHTHLFLDIVVPPEEELQRHANAEFAPGLLLAIVESPSKRALMAARLAREDLESGF